MAHRPGRQTTRRGEGGSHGLIGANEKQVRALKAENARLSQALHLREDILSLVAHDLQNTLTVIGRVASKKVTVAGEAGTEGKLGGADRPPARRDDSDRNRPKPEAPVAPPRQPSIEPALEGGSPVATGKRDFVDE